MNAVVGALACVWSGMVVAISFLRAPLTFREPRVARAGLSIGRVAVAEPHRRSDRR